MINANLIVFLSKLASRPMLLFCLWHSGVRNPEMTVIYQPHYLYVFVQHILSGVF